MSLELGRPAEGDQAESAEEPEEEGTATRSAADSPDAYADSGASPAPRFSALWGTSDASRASEPSTTADPPDDPEPNTAGPRTIPGTVVDSNTPDTSDTPEVANAPEASSTPATVDAREASDAADAPAVAQEHAESSPSDASGTAESGASDTSGAAEPAEEADDVTDAPGAHSVPAPRAPVTDADAGTPIDADAAGTPAPTVPEDMTVGTTATANTPAASADGEATVVPESSVDGGRPSVAARLEAAAGDLDGPLVDDVEGLRYSWQQIQIGFVDDPREAVVDAAVLVEHSAQALIGALQQRQRLLRSLWDRNTSLDDLGSPATGSPAEAPTSGRPQPASDIPDTEDLRLLIQRYRTMFNEICKP